MNTHTEQAVHKGLQRLGSLVNHHDHRVEESIIYMMLVRNINKMYHMDEKGIAECENLKH